MQEGTVLVDHWLQLQEFLSFLIRRFMVHLPRPGGNSRNTHERLRNHCFQCFITVYHKNEIDRDMSDEPSECYPSV